jgi:Escherichia/Staphylococcus phage prohead protease
MLKIERRFVRSGVELRASDEDDDELSISGLATPFESESEDMGGFREMVMPSAFSRALREGQDIRCLRNHDPNFVLGRTKNGTLSAWESRSGLAFRCTLDPKNPEHRATHAMVSRGDIDACSFAFTAKKQSWTERRGSDGEVYPLRLLEDVDLQDLSVVTYPAYRATSVQARNFPMGEVAEVRSALTAFGQKHGKRIYTVAEALKVVEPLAEQERKRFAMRENLKSIL